MRRRCVGSSRTSAPRSGRSKPQGSHVSGPHGPTAGPPPYAIYRLEPTTVFGLPGMFGMFESDQSHEPTRWQFEGD